MPLLLRQDHSATGISRRVLVTRAAAALAIAAALLAGRAFITEGAELNAAVAENPEVDAMHEAAIATG